MKEVVLGSGPDGLQGCEAWRSRRDFLGFAVFFPPT